MGRPERRGKWMLAPAGGRLLLFHFGITGRFVWTSRPGEPHRHDRLILALRGGELRYRNMRMLGGVWLARDPRHAERIPVRGRWLKSQRRQREPRCPRCHARVERETVVGRTAYWCPRCQP